MFRSWQNCFDIAQFRVLRELVTDCGARPPYQASQLVSGGINPVVMQICLVLAHGGAQLTAACSCWLVTERNVVNVVYCAACTRQGAASRLNTVEIWIHAECKG